MCPWMSAIPQSSSASKRQPCTCCAHCSSASDLQKLLGCTCLHPMGSHYHVPTAARPAALLQPLQHRYALPTHTHSPWPIAAAARGGELQVHLCWDPKGTPPALTTATHASGHHEQQQYMLSPRGAICPGPLQYLQGALMCCSSASAPISAAAILPCPLQHKKISTFSCSCTC
jgi:hypothetical protein